MRVMQPSLEAIAQQRAERLPLAHAIEQPGCESHALGRETATLTLASWARVEPSVVHALTHDHEDATSLRTRVARLESSIRDARRLIGDARLPAPSRDSPVELGRALDAHERLTTAYQTLTGALPDLPDTTPAVCEHTEPPPQRERILR